MKKIYLALLFAVFNLHAVNMRITKIVPDHNLYVFENKYVIQSSAPISGVYTGTYLDLNVDFFYTSDYWLQEIITTEYKHVGTTYDWGGITYEDTYTGERVTQSNGPKSHYAYVDQIRTYTFTPLGIVDSEPMSLNTFSYFASARAGEQPLVNYTSLYTDTGWVWSDKDLDRQSFPSVTETGQMYDIMWLVDEFSSYSSDFTHEIYPIYDRNNPRYLSGVLNCGYVRKLFLHDYANSLAFFEYN